MGALVGERLRRACHACGRRGRAQDNDDHDDVDDHDHVDHHAQRLHGWVDTQVSWPLVWQEECGLDDREVLVDETQLAALRAELVAVLDRYRRRGAGTPGARRVTAVIGLTPLPRRS